MIWSHRPRAHLERELAVTDLVVYATARTADVRQRLECRGDGEIVRKLELLANVERTPREGLSAVVVTLMEPHLRETRQDRGDLRVTRAERLLLDRQQPLKQRPR